MLRDPVCTSLHNNNRFFCFCFPKCNREIPCFLLSLFACTVQATVEFSYFWCIVGHNHPFMLFWKGTGLPNKTSLCCPVRTWAIFGTVELTGVWTDRSPLTLPAQNRGHHRETGQQKPATSFCQSFKTLHILCREVFKCWYLNVYYLICDTEDY